MSTIFKKVVTLGFQKLLPHTRLPSVFMTKTEDQLDDEPKDFVGDEYRVSGAPGFTDDRVRNANDYVTFAPRKLRPDLVGGGWLVSEDYPQSDAMGQEGHNI